MCGIIGYVGPNNAAARRLLCELFRQSRVRGLHSHGIAWWYEGLRSVQVDVGLELTPKELGHRFDGAEQIRVLGHTRYCTSDMKWPQPLYQGGAAIVLNGVISQAPPEQWPRPAGTGPYVTGNDAEVALRYWQADAPGAHGGSFAWGILTDDGDMVFLRNGERPLWRYGGADTLLVASTRDIFARSGFRSVMGHVRQVPVWTCLHGDGTVAAVSAEHRLLSLPDLQSLHIDPAFPVMPLP